LPSGVNLYVQALVALGREREAREAVAKLLATAPPDNLTWLAELFLWALDGRRDDIVSTLTPERVRWARADLQYSLQLAECFAMLGDNDRAFDWLENAVRCGVVNYPFLSRRDPFLSNLRRDPRFEPLIAHVKSIWQRVQGGLSRTNEPEIVPNTLLSQVVVRVGEFRPAGRHASRGTSNSYVPLGSLSETAPRFTIELAGGVYNPGTSVNFREW
jgi:hypothetical protein